MRILHIDPDDMDNPLSGGGPVRTFEIYRQIAKRHEVTVLTPTFPGSTPEKIRDGIRYVRLGRKIGNHGSSHHITFFFSLPRAVRMFDYDLLVEDFMPPFSVTMTPLFTEGPVIASVQWFFAESLSQQYHFPFYLGERYGLRLYKNFVVLTEEMKKTVQGRHPEALCRIIPNGVDSSLFAAKPSFEDFALYLGRVDFQQKGVDLLLQAYAMIPADKRLPLVIAGHTWYENELMALISQLGLGSWVKYIGKVEGEQKKQLLTTCRFVCVPSRAETFGMVITESCACGKPVVLFDKAPMNEVAAPRCLLVRPWDINAYSEAMADLMRADEQEMLSRSQDCRRWAQQFDWFRLSEQQENFYSEVASGGNR